MGIKGSKRERNYLAVQVIFKAILISKFSYGASIWHIPAGRGEIRKTPVAQLVHVQAQSLSNY